jgi:hypothetical protein
MAPSSSEQVLDHQLMARLRRGDERALEALLERHWDDLVGYAGSLLSWGDHLLPAAGSRAAQQPEPRLGQMSAVERGRRTGWGARLG